MDIVTLGAALNGSAEYVNSHFKGGSNIQIVNNPDGTQTINASGEVSSEDTVARAEIAAIKDGTNIDSFGDVESALGNKADSSTTYTKTEVDTALGGKVDKETGKGLSTNDYTDTEKAKLAGIEAQANKTTVDDSLSGSSTNPVQNKVVKTALDGKANASTTYTKTEVDTALSGKQATLTTAQLAAANSGITSADVAQITTNKNNILSIQDHCKYDDRQLYLQEAIPTENITVGSTWIDKKTISSYTDSTNIVGGLIEQGSWNINGLIKENTNLRCRLSNSIEVQPSTTYTITLDSPTINDARVLLQYRDINDYAGAESGWQSGLPYTFTTPANCRKATIIFSNSANSNCVPSDFGNLQINKGSTAQSYASPAWS